MLNRFAFAAKYWGDGAVVCRAKEGCAGPCVQQEFGRFDTWTQANAFAARLNEGLEIHPTEAKQIITSAALEASDAMRAVDPTVGACIHRDALAEGKALQVQFTIAELELAMTFCRIARCKTWLQSERMFRNARNALFDGMHFVCESPLADADVEAIKERLATLRAALEDSLAQR